MAIIPVEMFVDSSKYELKCPYAMTATRIVVHNTANDAKARNEISYMRNNNSSTSFHFAIDGNEVVQGIPLDRNGFHAGDGRNGKGNREGIGIEICYSLSGGDRFIAAEKKAAEFIAQLLKERNWGIERVTKHQDYSGKYCPHRTLDMGWQRFINMIKGYLGEKEDEVVENTTTNTAVKNETYKVVKTLNGYYTASNALNGTDARSIVNPGTYYVYNTSGKAVNVSKTKGKAGSWINTALNTVDAPDTKITSIKKGDKVKVKNGAKTYTGGNIASFVYNGTYTVDELVGDRAVLDKKGICTPVNVKDLTLASTSSATTKTTTTSTSSTTKTTNTTSSSSIKKGDKVKIKNGAKTYTGGKIADFVYNNVYTVDELKGDRAVLDAKGICTPVNVKDLTLASSSSTTSTKKTVKKGSKVKVNKNAKTYTGGKIANFVYNNVYTVDELKGDRAVLDAKGICTPVNVKDLTVV